MLPANLQIPRWVSKLKLACAPKCDGLIPSKLRLQQFCSPVPFSLRVTMLLFGLGSSLV